MARKQPRKSREQKAAEARLIDAVREEAWATAKGAEADRIEATLKRESANRRLVLAFMAEMGGAVAA